MSGKKLKIRTAASGPYCLLPLKSKLMKTNAQSGSAQASHPQHFRLDGKGIELSRGQNQICIDLDFSVSSGEILVLRGPNGSGKSSLLRAIAGFLPLTAGEISCNDWPFNAYRQEMPANALQCLWYAQEDGLATALTSLDNLSLMPQSARRADVEEQLCRYDPFGIASFLHQPIRSLSSGQRQRVALTRLCFSPSAKFLWLLDEPNSGLDRAGLKALEAVLAAHQEAGGLSIVASHHPLDSRLTPRYLDLLIKE
ncbi:MAG: heme ABC exporter ATP-binding protein CcmA [Rhodospirillaceae bacterium]|nr:heme ABC exporter ATP-binding protein CcmA [Rhodospirillaceae bacterium]